MSTRSLVPVQAFKILFHCDCGGLMKSNGGFRNSSGDTWYHKCVTCGHEEQIKKEGTGQIVYMTEEELKL